MSDIRMTVGAALDRSALTVFTPLVQAARKARQSIEKELNAATGGRRSRGSAAAPRVDGLLEPMKRFEKESAAIAKRVNSEYARAQRDQVRAAQQAAREKVRIEQQKNREFVRLERELTRDQAREQRAAARATHDASRRSARRNAIDRHSAMRGIGRGLGMARHATGFAWRMANEVAGQLGVEINPLNHLGEAQRAQSRAVQISNSGYIPSAGGSAAVKVDPRTIQREAMETAQATGQDYNETLTALDKFIMKTGDLETGRKILADMAKLSKATGTSMEDMTSAAADVSNALGDIPNKEKAIHGVMMAASEQGLVGAVEVRDFAKYMGRLTQQAYKFKVDPRQVGRFKAMGLDEGLGQNIAVMSALTQMARKKGARLSAAQASGAAFSFIRDVTGKATLKSLEAQGINPFTDASKTQVADPAALIMTILSKATNASGVDKSMLSKLMPNQQSRAVLESFAFDYDKGFKEARAGGASVEDAKRAAEKRALDAYEQVTSAIMSETELTEKFNAALNTSESAANKVNNSLTGAAEQIKDALTPALVELTPVIIKTSTALLDFATDALGLRDADRQRKGFAAGAEGGNTTQRLHNIAMGTTSAQVPFVGPLQPGQATPATGAITYENPNEATLTPEGFATLQKSDEDQKALEAAIAEQQRKVEKDRINAGIIESPGGLFERGRAYKPGVDSPEAQDAAIAEARRKGSSLVNTGAVSDLSNDKQSLDRMVSQLEEMKQSRKDVIDGITRATIKVNIENVAELGKYLKQHGGSLPPGTTPAEAPNP